MSKETLSNHSQRNLSVIENFILFLTHCSDDKEPDFTKPQTYTPEELYRVAYDYILEDHVDGEDSEEAINERNSIKQTKLQKGWIKQANKYLHFEDYGNDYDQTTLNVIAKIRDHADQNAMIDHVLGDDENVFPCEDFEYRFTCETFLVMIGYKTK